jgi:hypothetical protein
MIVIVAKTGLRGVAFPGKVGYIWKKSIIDPIERHERVGAGARVWERRTECFRQTQSNG